MSGFNRSGTIFECRPDCPDRKPGCHGTCDKYRNKRAEYDTLKAEEKKRRAIDDYKKDGYYRARYARIKSQKYKKGRYGYSD